MRWLARILRKVFIPSEHEHEWVYYKCRTGSQMLEYHKCEGCGQLINIKRSSHGP